MEREGPLRSIEVPRTASRKTCVWRIHVLYAQVSARRAYACRQTWEWLSQMSSLWSYMVLLAEDWKRRETLAHVYMNSHRNHQVLRYENVDHSNVAVYINHAPYCIDAWRRWAMLSLLSTKLSMLVVMARTTIHVAGLRPGNERIAIPERTSVEIRTRAGFAV
jgi:hypothetical protein